MIKILKQANYMNYFLWVIASLAVIAFLWYFVRPFLIQKYMAYRVYKSIKSISDAHEGDADLKKAADLSRELYESIKMFQND